MKFDVIINPAGAGGKTVEFWQSCAPKFSDCDMTVHYSSAEDTLEAIARRLTSAGEEVFLLVVGGDGTINNVVNGIADFEHTRFAFLPCGSANDLALDLLRERTTEELIETIRRGEIVRDIDVGEVILHNEVNRVNLLTNEIDPREVNSERRRRFNVSAGMGWDAEICERVMFSKFKKPLNRIRLGKLVYIVEAVRSVFAMQKYHCTLTLDDAAIDIPACMFNAVMNHRFEGGGFMFGPHAKNNDGLLDICTAADLSALDFFCLFPLAYSGRHVGRREVYEHSAKEIRIESNVPVWVHTDGEVLAQSTDISLHLLPEKLHLLF